MLPNDAILMYNPYQMVRLAQRLPKPLKLIDNNQGQDEYFIEPIIEGEDMETAKIFYKLPTKFARKLLADDERFTLCLPKQLMVQRKNKKKFSRLGAIIKSCGEMPDEEKKLTDDQLESVMVKRHEIEESEEEILGKGEVPAHMQKNAAAVNANAKKQEMTAAENLKQMEQRQAANKVNQRKQFIPTQPDDPNFKYEPVKTEAGHSVI